LMLLFVAMAMFQLAHDASGERRTSEFATFGCRSS